jgi:cytochrome b561
MSDTPAGAAGYGLVAKLLHWLVFIALAVQFTVGYAIERSDDLLAWFVDGWLGGEEDRLVLVHAGIGVSILLLAIVRLVWRRTVGLPPWAEGLSTFERGLAHRVEQVLYAAMFLIPLTGLALLLLTGEDWDLTGSEWVAPVELADDDVVLGAHIATHLAFFVAFTVHVGMVLRHQILYRDGLLRRML